MTVSRSSCALCLLALVLAPWLTIERSRAQTQPGPYAVTDLGPVGTVTAQANDINDAGQAVGSFSATGTTGPRAFVWQDGLLTVLSSLHSGATGISPNGGLIVGTVKIPPSTVFEGAIFENGGVTPLGFQGTIAAAVNDHRQVVGTINHAMPFLWENGVLTQLGTLGGPCGSAADINHLAQVVGNACTSTGTELGPSTHAFLWQGGVMTEIEPFPGHVDSGATAINSLGQIAGWSSITDPEIYDVQATSFIYENGAKRALSIPSTEDYAYDINDLGHVVGTMRAGGFRSNFSGYIFKDGVATNLNTVLLPGSGMHILYAHAINNAGEIVGIAYDSRYSTRAVLLTPVAADTPIVNVGNASATEGHLGTSPATVTVSLSQASSQPVSVSFSTSNGTASASDYQATSGTVTFNPGETSRTITVLVNGDRVGEADETFSVNLSSATGGATLGDATGAVTIVDDEVRVTIGDATRNEGNTGTTPFAFSVTLSAATDIPVTMNFTTADHQAKAADDYIAQTGSLTFNPGEKIKTITIAVRGDRKVELGEMFFVNLSNVSGGFSSDWSGVGLIRNDDR
jgi:probable HAF family extracellular repeat protein